jgi:hypothetical protein
MVTKKSDEDEVVEVSEGKSVYRVSFSIDPSLRRKIRIASALHDMDQGEWMAEIISRAASKALEDVKQ